MGDNIDFYKIQEGHYERIRGALNRLRVVAENPHQLMRFAEGIANYFRITEQAKKDIGPKDTGLESFNGLFEELFRRFAIKLAEKKE